MTASLFSFLTCIAAVSCINYTGFFGLEENCKTELALHFAAGEKGGRNKSHVEKKLAPSRWAQTHRDLFWKLKSRFRSQVSNVGDCLSTRTLIISVIKKVRAEDFLSYFRNTAVTGPERRDKGADSKHTHWNTSQKERANVKLVTPMRRLYI